MKLIFNIDYQTVFGEELLLNLVEKDGAENHVSSYRMKTEDGMRWTYELNCPAARALATAEPAPSGAP